MQSQLNPYLNFRDNTRQAMAFYHTIFGGALTMNTYKKFCVSPDAGENDKMDLEQSGSSR